MVSDGYFNNVQSSLVMVRPITFTDNGYPLHVPVAPGNAVDGYSCLETLRAMDLEARRARPLEDSLDNKTMSRVLDGLGAIFAIEKPG